MTTIRLATTQDIPDCLEASASRKDVFFTKEDFVRALDDSNAIYLVAEEDEKIAGFVIGYANPTKNEEAMIQSTMVNARHGNKGIGSTLVRAFADHAFGSGVNRVFAEVEDGPDRFYEKCGFKRAYEWHSMCLSGLTT